jgi:malate dehydrogenase
VSDVAIIGAGELGGALAHQLARRGSVRAVQLIDEYGRIAEGKALDIGHAAPIEGFACAVSGGSELAAAIGASYIAIADRASGEEWPAEEVMVLIRQLTAICPDAAVVCAGASHREIVDRSVRDLKLPRLRVLGSAPEALGAAARALAGLEGDVSPEDVSVVVLGVPPDHLVICWESASIGGFAATTLLSDPVRRRLTRRIVSSWPPGPYALATAASRIVDGLVGRSRRLVSCFVAPDDREGIRMKTAALPIRFDVTGTAAVVLPPLTGVERFALENAMLL